jgi:cytoskeleton protein RodZ
MEPSSKSLGTTLQAARLHQGIELSAIEATTKISCCILQAIENDQFDSIPGGSYRRSFVRQYARALGIDEKEALATLDQQVGVPSLPLPIPPKEKSFGHYREVLWIVIGVAGLVGLFKVSESQFSPGHWTTMQVALPASHQEQPAPSGKAVATASLETSGSTGSADRSASAVRVELTASEPVWLSVECDGSPRYTGTLLGPTVKTFEASKVVKVLVGNAGGLTISLNGKPVGPVGGHGETRLLELTSAGAQRLSNGPAAQKPVNFVPED